MYTNFTFNTEIYTEVNLLFEQ